MLCTQSTVSLGIGFIYFSFARFVFVYVIELVVHMRRTRKFSVLAENGK